MSDDPAGEFDVVVVGSLNRDYTCRLDRLPGAGETVLGGDLVVGSGGKGGNQAVAAARAGVRCSLAGAVGDDEDGRALVDDLVAAGVYSGEVVVSQQRRTGAAMVLVTGMGESSIVVAPGANTTVRPAAVRRAVARLKATYGVVVTQAEIPVAALTEAMQAAVDRRARPVLNLAPFVSLPAAVLRLADPLVVNQSEAGALLGAAVRTNEDANEAVRRLSEVAGSVVVTAGADGAVLAESGEARPEWVPARQVDVVDTTGAGDAFTGALAAALSRRETLPAAVRAGVAAGSRAVAHTGARPRPGRSSSVASTP